MPTTEVSDLDLLGVVRQMPPEEFDAFIEQALSLRRLPTADTLSPRETELIQQINRGLPADLSRRFAQLVRRRKKGNLTVGERQELLRLTHEVESQDADRAAALLELARVRRVPLRILMKQMGIQAP